MDVSYPQCDAPLPANEAFAIVGVNGEYPNEDNECLVQELAWAARSAGGSAQPKTQLYVTFANPGLDPRAKFWPTSNTYKGITPSNRFGKCGTKGGKKQLTLACSFVYGYSLGYDDVTIRGIERPAAYRWWIDVELNFSHQSATSQNRAALEGMIAGLKAGGVRTIGIYSTPSQWKTIAGSVGKDSILYGRSNWIALGRSTITKARQACSSTPLSGGKIAMVQIEAAYGSGTIDRDVSCT
ncbi:hypothetical protein [Curtobacterium sp. 260]|uniref:hypothetical protein n=1 Tax=Curtobacterium sp. 260 TaxID=2817748 RepID=UPI00278B1108|nr:hypothetical protein [Curtobacterium sp. 260]MDP9737916.1 hypothetical protein [Curtobacterium sp. 260]